MRYRIEAAGLGHFELDIIGVHTHMSCFLLPPLLAAASRKRHHTEEELALKKSEITRRRKNQSAQRAEQDKLETINRLLKKQAGKRKKGAQDDDDGGEDKNNGEGNDGNAGGRGASGGRNRFNTPSSYLRVTCKVDGTKLSIPEQSLEDVPAWMQQSIPPIAETALSANDHEYRAIKVLETPVVPLKEPSYPAPKGKCAVSKCDQQWKYRGPKSKKVACGLEHLKLIEAGA